MSSHFMDWLHATPLPVLSALMFLLVFGALETGRRLGQLAPAGDREVSNVGPPVLALVGLLLAFSFSMAGDRYAQRRAAAVQEANSIGTLWLRTSLMPEPVRSEMRSRIMRYVDLHIEHREAGEDEQVEAAVQAEAARLQQELWSLLIAEARREPEGAHVRLLTFALNSMIDDTASVLAAKDNRLPGAIFVYLLVLVVIAGIVIGYRPPGEKRNLVLWTILTVVLSGIMIVLFDMDRPRSGWIQTAATPYRELRESIREFPLP